MKKIAAIFLFFVCGFLSANDYRWDLVSALARNEYNTVENIINANIESVPNIEKMMIMNMVLIYSRGETALRALHLLQRHNVIPGPFDLYTAINRNQPDPVVYFIINNGANATGEILLLAMERQRFDLAARFARAGIDVNYQYPSGRNSSDGMTALLHAANYNNFEMVKLLVEHGANVNTRNREGSTALSIAQSNDNVQIISFLIENGARDSVFTPPPAAQQSGGITSLDNLSAGFQPGTYRQSGGNRVLTFTGTSSSGMVSFMSGSNIFSGTYQISGGNLTLTMDERVFFYRLDAGAASFSGNGETWTRVTN